MIMLFNLAFDVMYYGDLYLASTPQGTAPKACVMCDSGGLLFYPHHLQFQSQGTT
jgi:hypothetical protein